MNEPSALTSCTMTTDYSLLLQKYQELEEEKWYLLGQNERLVKELEDALETSEDKTNADAETIKALKDESAALRERLEILSKSKEKQTEEYICVDREHGLWKRKVIYAARKEAQP